MWTFIRVAISVVAGFFLMLPLGSLYGSLKWPTFHGWGLMHGSYLSAWPTLSIFSFLVLGYLRRFPRVEDTPLLIAGLAWGLVLTGFLAISASPWLLSPSTVYALLAVTSVIVALLSFFAGHKLRLALFVVLPFVFLKMDFLFVAITPALRPLLFYDLLFALKDITRPLIFALIGWGLGSLASTIKKRSTAAM
jgi:hypothetical protein